MVGPFGFRINDLDPEQNLIEKKTKSIVLNSLVKREEYEFNYGYLKNDYLLLIDEKNENHAVSNSYSSIFTKFSKSIIMPEKIFENGLEKFVSCFDQDIPGEIWKIRFFELGFKIDSDNFTNKDIEKLYFVIDESGENATLKAKFKRHKGINIFGPEKYIKAVWKEFANRKTAAGMQKLSSNHLYEEYNKRKKENLLIGLLSDITLFNKELDTEISLDHLKIKLDSVSESEFKKDKELYVQTIKKLLMFSNLIPKMKQDYVRIDTFYPHYQLKNELNFIAKVFVVETAKKMEPSEFENVIRSSRYNINFLQSRFNKIFFEIEKAISPIENIFAGQEIKKDFIANVAKYSVPGGQAILVGGLVASGAAMGGVGILAGMLGIRTMGDILSSFHQNKNEEKLIKSSAQKIFVAWQLFKETFPMTIYEVSKMIDKENERTLNRDKKIFKHLNQTVSLTHLNETLKKEIEQSNQIKFEEVLNNSGVLFGEIATEINEKIQKNIYLDFENENNELTPSLISKGEIIND